MCRTVIRLASVVIAIGLSTTAGYGQLLGVYEFDGGGDGSSWDDAANWEQVLDPFGNPISGNPATPPGPTTSAELPLPGVVIDNTMPGQTALDARIGTTAGVGSLNMSGGGLTVRDFNIGADSAGANAGSFTLSDGTLTAGDDISVGAGSVGTMTMSGGTASVNDDFNINANSTLTLTGGTIEIGDRLVMRTNGHLLIEGGEIIAEDDFFILDNATVTMEGGLMSTVDKLNMGNATPMGPARLVINDGIMRSNEWTDDSELEFNDPTRFMSVIEINGSGKLQVEQATFPRSEANFLIAEGVHLTTTEPGGLGVQTVIVPEFFGRTDVVFTQVSVIPEPASLVLLGLGALCLVVRRTRA
ncbi:MAG: PEP-CTERM sorting domain-containing protein [Pirellulales bacterium]